MKLSNIALALFFTLPPHGAYATESTKSDDRQNDRLEELMEYGEHLAQTCVSCHALTSSNSRIPVIAGWPRNEMILRLNAFKNRDIKNNVMSNIASALDQLDILAVATYLSSLKRPSPQKQATH